MASFNYMFVTGDYEPLKKADPYSRYANEGSNAVIIYSSGWWLGIMTHGIRRLPFSF